MNKIPADKYKKLRFQAKSQMEGILYSLFDMYGLGLYIPDTSENLMVIAQLFCENVRGDEKPITVEMVKHRRRKKTT